MQAVASFLAGDDGEVERIRSRQEAHLYVAEQCDRLISAALDDTVPLMDSMKDRLPGCAYAVKHGAAHALEGCAWVSANRNVQT